MARYDAKVLTHPVYGEVRFGKNDKIVAVPLGPVDRPEGIAFIARDGSDEAFSFADYSEEMKYLLMAHGAKQKLKDKHASLDDSAECLAASKATHEQLAAGTWAAQGGGGIGLDSILVDALVELGAERPTAIATLKAASPAERAALKADGQVKPIYDRLMAAKAKGVDTAGLLSKILA